MQQPSESSIPSRTPRVLFVDQTAQLGGAELWLKDVVLGRGGTDKVFLFQEGPLEKALLDEQVEVVAQPGSSRIEGLKKESGLLVKLLSSFSVLSLVRSVARAAKNCDVIYANTPKALVVSALAGVIARKPVIYHLHDILSREHFSRSNLKVLVGLSNRLVRRVVANSQATLDAYRAAGGKCVGSISYNGFDAHSFESFIADRQLHRAKLHSDLQLEPAARIVAIFGRLAPWKGQHLAIQAWRQVPQAHLVLVGDALFGEADYKLELERLAREPAVAGRVHFLGFRRDVFALMQATDIVLHASIAPEPFGRVIVEAMLSRRPIVAVRAGGAAEIVTDGTDGWLFTSGDEHALADCVRRVLASSEADLKPILDQAHQSAAQRFSLRKAVEDVNAVVEDCVRRHRS